MPIYFLPIFLLIFFVSSLLVACNRGNQEESPDEQAEFDQESGQENDSGMKAPTYTEEVRQIWETPKAKARHAAHATEGVEKAVKRQAQELE